MRTCSQVRTCSQEEGLLNCVIMLHVVSQAKRAHRREALSHPGKVVRHGLFADQLSPTARRSPHFCQAPPQRRQIALGKSAAGTVPTAPDSTGRPDLDLPAFRRFSMITARAGHSASAGPLTAPARSFSHAGPAAAIRRRQAVSFEISRDGGGKNQRTSHCTSPRCAVVAWPATDCGELATAASAAMDKVMLP